MSSLGSSDEVTPPPAIYGYGSPSLVQNHIESNIASYIKQFNKYVQLVLDRYLFFGITPCLTYHITDASNQIILLSKYHLNNYRSSPFTNQQQQQQLASLISQQSPRSHDSLSSSSSSSSSGGGSSSNLLLQVDGTLQSANKMTTSPITIATSPSRSTISSSRKKKSTQSTQHVTFTLNFNGFVFSESNPFHVQLLDNFVTLLSADYLKKKSGSGSVFRSGSSEDEEDSNDISMLRLDFSSRTRNSPLNALDYGVISKCIRKCASILVVVNNLIKNSDTRRTSSASIDYTVVIRRAGVHHYKFYNHRNDLVTNMRPALSTYLVIPFLVRLTKTHVKRQMKYKNYVNNIGGNTLNRMKQPSHIDNLTEWAVELFPFFKYNEYYSFMIFSNMIRKFIYNNITEKKKYIASNNAILLSTTLSTMNIVNMDLTCRRLWKEVKQAFTLASSNYLIYSSTMSNEILDWRDIVLVRNCNQLCNILSKIDGANVSAIDNAEPIVQSSFNVFLVVMLNHIHKITKILPNNILSKAASDKNLLKAESTEVSKFERLSKDREEIERIISDSEIHCKHIENQAYSLQHWKEQVFRGYTTSSMKLFDRGEHLLFDAVRLCNLDLIKIVVNQFRQAFGEERLYFFINHENSNGITPLHLVHILYGRILKTSPCADIIKFLEDNGARRNEFLISNMEENKMISKLESLNAELWLHILSFRAYSMRTINALCSVSTVIMKEFVNCEVMWQKVCYYYFTKQNVNSSLLPQIEKIERLVALPEYRISWRYITKCWTQPSHFKLFVLDPKRTEHKHLIERNSLLSPVRTRQSSSSEDDIDTPLNTMDFVSLLETLNREASIHIIREDILSYFKQKYSRKEPALGHSILSNYSVKCKALTIHNLYFGIVSKLTLFKQKWIINFVDCIQFTFEKKKEFLEHTHQDQIVCYQFVLTNNFGTGVEDSKKEEFTFILVFNKSSNWLGCFEL